MQTTDKEEAAYGILAGKRVVLKVIYVYTFQIIDTTHNVIGQRLPRWCPLSLGHRRLH